MDDWLLLYNLHEAIEHFLEVQALGPTIQLSAFNYSLAPTQLREQARGWLEIPRDAPLADPPSARVNRSLDQQELRALLVLNRLLGSEAQGIGRRLVRELPDLRAGATVASPEAQIRFLNRLTAAVARINAFLPPDQALRLRSRRASEPCGDDGIRLLPDQLEVIAAELLRLGATGVQALSPRQP